MGKCLSAHVCWKDLEAKVAALEKEIGVIFERGDMKLAYSLCSVPDTSAHAQDNDMLQSSLEVRGH